MLQSQMDNFINMEMVVLNDGKVFADNISLLESLVCKELACTRCIPMWILTASNT